GIGGARNDGVEAARAPVVFTTDADVIVPPHWLERGLSYFGRPGVVAVVGPNRPIERERLRARVAFWLVEKVHAFSALIRVPGTPGNNTAFRRDAFQRIGGYRPLDYCDDVDMGFRLRHMGEIVYDREMAVLASTRRMEKDGYARTLWLWLSGEIRLLMGREVRRKKYARKES
ncbi:MAG: glycosyltransferase, partial [Euryarchaeota archaeon]|nr:glycosyltransferase [Euryarchaeota archaeon]